MHDRQGSLFGRKPTLRDILDASVVPRDPSVPDEATPRLSDQCKAILARLREGPATNRELATISLKYTGRLSDLRAAGYIVKVIHHDRKSGLVTYELGPGFGFFGEGHA